MKNPRLKDLKQRNQKNKRMDRQKVGMLPSMDMSQLVVSSA